jgi:hypothetical protein
MRSIRVSTLRSIPFFTSSPVDLGHLGAEAVEDAGELDGDVAAAVDRDALGQALQVKGLVRRDAVVPTGARREHRPAAGGDQDGLGREAPFLLAVGGLDVHPVLVQQTTVAAQHLDPGLLKKALVDPFQAVDLPVLVGDEARPVEGGLADLPAEAGSVLEVLVEVAGIDQELLGHAAADDAGAAVAVGLDNGHLGAGLRCHARRAHAARAAADDEEVEVVVRHASSLSRCRRSTLDRGARL